MLGLMYLAAITAYLVVMGLAIRWGWKAGRLNGRGWPWGVFGSIVGFLVVYLPVFWNHIPVVLEQRRLCAKDAGFTVYVTAADWARQNEDLRGSVGGKGLSEVTSSTTFASGRGMRIVFFGGALMSETVSSVDRRLGVEFWRVESTLRDQRRDVVLTRDVSYSVGPREMLRFWLVGYSCPRQRPDQMLPHVRYSSELKEYFK